MKFSERNGYKSVRQVLQKGFIDEDLKVELRNITYSKVIEKIEYDTKDCGIAETFWCELLKQAIDDIPGKTRLINHIKTNYFQAEWFEVYDFIEFTRKILNHPNHFDVLINNCLEKNMSAYRLLDGNVTEITSEEEILSIEESLTSHSKFIGKDKHLHEAIKFISDKKNPNYRSSIKESFSALESVCRTITGESTLGAALKKLQKDHKVHSFITQGFEKFYIYTNDGATGVRHALMEEGIEISFEDAKFFLVSCTAFINFLIAKFG